MSVVRNLRFLTLAVLTLESAAIAREPARPHLTIVAPQVPQSVSSEHPIDRFVEQQLGPASMNPARVVSDSTFARRVYLDLVGLPPTPQQLDQFLNDDSPNKRIQLIDRLLNDRRAYADHWLTFWNDALRNAYRGTGFIDNGRQQITEWLYRSLYENKPYDQFVAELVNPAIAEGSSGFLKGIKWRGVVNESQRREIQAAQSIAQVFLGTNLKCASCHDSFINDWKLSEAYGFSSVFADQPLEIHRCNKPVGTTVSPQFIFPELGPIGGSTIQQRQDQLAKLMVQRENGRLALTIVNRLWARLLGRGLVEPVDEMESTAWNEPLLNYLAWDLIQHGYDLKHTLRRITSSTAYQMAAVQNESDEPYQFRGPLIKRLTAEQFIDSVRQLTHDPTEISPAMAKVDGRGQGGQHTMMSRVVVPDAQSVRDRAGIQQVIDRAHWVWAHDQAMRAAGGEAILLRKRLEPTVEFVDALAVFSADNSLRLFADGKVVARADDWSNPVVADITQQLRDGQCQLAIHAVNGATTPNPAGVIGVVLLLDQQGQVVQSWVTDGSWRASKQLAKRWQTAAFDDSGWPAATKLASSAAAPWNIQAKLLGAASGAQAPSANNVRTSWTHLDALQSALGRPHREQVVTQRDSLGTMLQALELTNGRTLQQMVAKGAEYWHAQELSPAELCKQLYLAAVSRPPNADELAVLKELLGQQPDREALEDVLWILVMLPDFQLIY